MRDRPTPKWTDALRALWGQELRWVYIAVGTALSLILGYVGFAQYGVEHNRHYTVLDLIYLSWQLFPLQSGALEGHLPWQIEVARVLAPIVAASAIFEVLLDFVRERWRSIRLATISDHVVICGLGPQGVQLVEDCAAQGYRVVAVESSAGMPGIDAARLAGALVVVGEMGQKNVLLRAQLSRAYTLIAVSTDDAVNIEIAVRAAEIANQSSAAGHLLPCYVQLNNFALSSQFKEHAVWDAFRESLDVTVFNSFENAARILLRNHPLDGNGISPGDARQVHLVIMGLGQMGESVLVQAAKTGHFANGRSLRITVVDRAPTLESEILARYPSIRSVCDLSFLPFDRHDPRVAVCIAESAGDANALVHIVICFDDDAGNLQLALSLRRQFPALAVHLRLSQSVGWRALLDQVGGHTLSCFGMPQTASSWEIVKDGTLDQLARLTHEEYANRKRSAGRGQEASVVPWNRLSSVLQDANRQQADHLPVKLRALGYPVRIPADFPESVTVPPEMLEPLARMEHARWNAERYLNGWTLGDKDVAARRTPYLVPYDALPDEIQELDREAVRNVPMLVRAVHAARKES